MGIKTEIRGNLLRGFGGERLSRELLENSVKAIQGTREGPTVVRIAVAASTSLLSHGRHGRVTRRRTNLFASATTACESCTVTVPGAVPVCV